MKTSTTSTTSTQEIKAMTQVLNSAYDEIENHKNAIEGLQKTVDSNRAKIIMSVDVTEGDASILTSVTGEQIIIEKLGDGIYKNVHEYNGKKGEAISLLDRQSLSSWRFWLATKDTETK